MPAPAPNFTRVKTFSQVSFDRTTADFSNLQAETDAMERAAREIGNDIRTRLAAYFATRVASAGRSSGWPSSSRPHLQVSSVKRI